MNRKKGPNRSQKKSHQHHDAHSKDNRRNSRKREGREGSERTEESDRLPPGSYMTTTERNKAKRMKRFKQSDSLFAKLAKE